MVKPAGNGGSIKNMNTCRLFLDPKKREKVVKLYNFKNEKEKENFELLLHQAKVILSVTNSVGLIKVSKFSAFLKQSYQHWTESFKHLRRIKSSLHWTLAHLGELLAKNEGFSLAEVSENSFEALIKEYRFVTSNMARAYLRELF